MYITRGLVQLQPNPKGATNEHISVSFYPPIINFIENPHRSTIEIHLPNSGQLELKPGKVKGSRLYNNGENDWEWNSERAFCSDAKVLRLSSFSINPNEGKNETAYTDERDALIEFITLVEERQQNAARIIAKYWRRASSDPSYKICINRLKREYVECLDEV